MCQQELGDDQLDDQGPNIVPPSGGAKDHKNDGKMWDTRRVRVLIGRGGDRSYGYQPHRGVHKYAADTHSREGGLLPCLCTVH